MATNDTQEDPNALFAALDDLHIPEEVDGIFGFGQALSSDDEDATPAPALSVASRQPFPPTVAPLAPPVAPAALAAPPAPPVATAPVPPPPAASTKPKLSMAASIFGVMDDDDSDQDDPPPPAPIVATTPAPPPVAAAPLPPAPPSRPTVPISHPPPPVVADQEGPADTEKASSSIADLKSERQKRNEQAKQLQRQFVLSKEVESHLQHRSAAAETDSPSVSIEEKLQARKDERAAAAGPSPPAPWSQQAPAQMAATEAPHLPERSLARQTTLSAKEMLRALSASKQRAAGAPPDTAQNDGEARTGVDVHGATTSTRPQSASVTPVPSPAPSSRGNRDEGFENPLAALRRNQKASTTVPFQPPLPMSPPPVTPGKADGTAAAAAGGYERQVPLKIEVPQDSPVPPPSTEASPAGTGSGGRSYSRGKSYAKIMGGKTTPTPPATTSVGAMVTTAASTKPFQPQPSDPHAWKEQRYATTSDDATEGVNSASGSDNGPARTLRTSWQSAAPPPPAPAAPSAPGGPFGVPPPPVPVRGASRTTPTPPAPAPPAPPLAAGTFSPMRTAAVKRFDASDPGSALLSRSTTPTNTRPITAFIAGGSPPNPMDGEDTGPVAMQMSMPGMETGGPLDDTEDTEIDRDAQQPSTPVSSLTSLNGSEAAAAAAKKLFPGSALGKRPVVPVWASLVVPPNALNKIATQASRSPTSSPQQLSRKQLGSPPESPKVAFGKSNRSPNPVRTGRSDPLAAALAQQAASKSLSPMGQARDVRHMSSKTAAISDPRADPSSPAWSPTDRRVGASARPLVGSVFGGPTETTVTISAAEVIDAHTSQSRVVVDATLPNSVFVQQTRDLLSATQTNVQSVAQAFNVVLPAVDELQVLDFQTGHDGPLNAFEQLLAERQHIAATILQLQELEALSLRRIEQAEQTALQQIQLEAKCSQRAVADAEADLGHKVASFQEKAEEEDRTLCRWQQKLDEEQAACDRQHQRRIAQLAELAVALAEQNKQLVVQKRRVREQRFRLDLALQDLNGAHSAAAASTPLSPLLAAAHAFNVTNPTAGLPPDDALAGYAYLDTGARTFDPSLYQGIDYLAPGGLDDRLQASPSPPHHRSDPPADGEGSQRPTITTVEDDSSRPGSAHGGYLSGDKPAAAEEDTDEQPINREEFVKAVRRFKAEQARQNSDPPAQIPGIPGNQVGRVPLIGIVGANTGIGNKQLPPRHPSPGAGHWAERLSVGARVGGPRPPLSASYDSGSDTHSRATSADRSSVRSGTAGSRGTPSGYASSITTVADRRRGGSASARSKPHHHFSAAVDTPGALGTESGMIPTVTAAVVTRTDFVPISRGQGPAGVSAARVAVSPLATRIKRSSSGAMGSPAAYKTIKPRPFK